MRWIWANAKDRSCETAHVGYHSRQVSPGQPDAKRPFAPGVGQINRGLTEVRCAHGIIRILFPCAKRSTPKSRRSSVKIDSIRSRFARCTSDASASCIPKPAYLARIAAMAGRSVSSRGRNSKGRPRNDARSLRMASGYARRSHAASVITGQHVSSGPLMLRSCSTHASWCSSDSSRIATIGPVSTSSLAVKSHRIRRNTSGSY